MKIQVGLLDESAIIKKMLSHCLYHFVVDIHAFKNWDQCLLHSNNKSLSILFVDWDMFHGKARLIDLARKELSSVPAVLMHRQDSEEELSQLGSFIPHRIKKPLNPKLVREVFSKLVPQITESSIHSFLQFPKAAPSNELNPTPTAPSTQTSALPSLSTHTTAQKTALSSAPPRQMSPNPTQKPHQTLSVNSQAQTSPQDSSGAQAPPLSIKPSSPRKLNKSEIVLNEDTKNDLAPMAIKSSGAKKLSSSTDSKLTEEQILEVLKKYKDSLEFTKLMESILAEHAKEALQSVLEPEKTKSLMRESIQSFQEGEKFKKQIDEQIESQIKAYLKEELPFKIKSVIQEEIKKILSD